MAKGLIRSRARSAAILDPNGFKRFRVLINSPAVTFTTITTSAGFAALPLPLPEGFVYIACAGGFVNYSTVSANVTNTTFGSTLSIGSVADASGAGLTSTKADIALNPTAPAAVAKAVTQAPVFTSKAGGTAQTPPTIDNHTGSTTIFLNINIATADFSDGTTAAFAVTGYIDIICAVLGDN
jgi:hypothetical protein